MRGCQDTEKAKVLQSIASIIQALPPMEAIPPVEALVSPVVARLFEALHLSTRVCRLLPCAALGLTTSTSFRMRRV